MKRPRLPRKGKVTRKEAAKRAAFVEEQLGLLVSFRLICVAFRTRFKTSTRTAERYIRRVHEAWAAESAAKPGDRKTKLEEIERAADAAFRIAMKGKNARAAITALDLKARLHALYKPERIGSDDAPIQLVFESEPTPPDHVSPASDVASKRDSARN